MIAIEAFYAAAARCGLLTAVKVGSVTVSVAFRAPDESVFDGLALSRDYQIEYPTEQLVLAQGDTLEINGTTYRVREVRQVRDGSETMASLSRL